MITCRHLTLLLHFHQMRNGLRLLQSGGSFADSDQRHGRERHDRQPRRYEPARAGPRDPRHKSAPRGQVVTDSCPDHRPHVRHRTHRPKIAQLALESELLLQNLPAASALIEMLADRLAIRAARRPEAVFQQTLPYLFALHFHVLPFAGIELLRSPRPPLRRDVSVSDAP